MHYSSDFTPYCLTERSTVGGLLSSLLGILGETRFLEPLRMYQSSRYEASSFLLDIL